MRTSTKGGRSSSWGGGESGQSGAPTRSSPVSRYQSSSRRRSAKGQFLRGFGWFLVVVLVIGAGIGGGLYLYYNQTLTAVNGNGNKAIDKAKPWIYKLGSVRDPAVALIAGYDHRAGTGTNAYAGSNSDTLMLLRANPKNDTLSLLSFPRDLNVPIYCKGNAIHTYDRVNAAWADCGSDGGPLAALDTIEHLTGLKVRVNYLITLDFRAFKMIVNRLHGVYLNVDRRYLITPSMGLDTSVINLQPGYEKLDGGQALSYVRFRHFDSDIYRNGRQQLFLEALKGRLKSTLTLSNLFEVPSILGAVKDNLQIEKADGSNVTYDEIKAYLGLLLGLPAGHLLRNAIPIQDLSNYVVNGADELQASPGAVAAAVHAFLHPVVPKVHHHTPGTGGKTPKLPHKQVSVLVLNAGNIIGEASDTSYKLHKDGFATKKLPSSTPANAPSKTRDTIVYYDASQATGLKAAEELAPLFGAHTRVASMSSAISPFAQQAGSPITVVAIGTAYNGNLKLPHGGGRAPGGSTANAQVTDGIPITLSAVRSENGPAHFPLMYAKRVADGSALSTEEGVRLFGPLRGKQELALTFNITNTVEYWQIEESNWTTEPLLQSPTHTFTSRGRKYEEFTSGGKIQTIAVFVGQNVYWVQNTILNDLSNSTMVAIAESLSPLR